MLATTPPRTVRTGPWTVHLCVTAACTGCGGVPLDEDTGITPHFAGPDQAVEELTQEWGWYFTAFPARLGRGEELLCPGCAAAVGYDGSPWPPASHPDGGQGAGATSWEYPEQFGDGLPANTRCFPSAAGRTREEG
jgi:hypothetical protein